MDNKPENNFFQITLSQQGANWLLRVSRITAWTFVLICITCLLTLIGVGARLFVFNETVIEDNWASIVEIIGLPLFEVLFVILGFIQMYHYLKFTRLCRKGIELQQDELFNEAFQSLLKNAIMVIVLAILQLLSTGVVVFWELVVDSFSK